MTGASVEQYLPMKPASYHILLALGNGPSHGYAIRSDVEALDGGRGQAVAGDVVREYSRADGRRADRTGGCRMVAEVDARRRYYGLTSLGQPCAGGGDVTAARDRRVCGAHACRCGGHDT